MKILMLADGSSAHTQRFQQAVQKEGHDIYLASLEKGPTVDHKFRRRLFVPALDYMLAAGELGRLIKRIKPDLINPHFACNYGIMTSLSMEARSIPKLLHCLGSDILISPHKSPLHRMRIQYTLVHFPEILVDSVYLGEEARKIWPRIQYQVIPWGADEAAFGHFAHRSHPDFMTRLPLKIIVPRPHKSVYNNEFIIRDLRDNLDRREIELTFPDWGDRIKEFRKLVHQLCPRGIIKYYGFMGREEYNDFLAEFDIYLSASRSDSSPASLIEAMAGGLFPIAADIPGIREWLTADNGLLFDAEKPGSLAAALNILRQDDLDIGEILDKNHERARRDGLFTENIRTTLALMKEKIRYGRS